jgi:hypothetical protein
MAIKRSVKIAINDDGWTRRLDIQTWHYHFGKKYLKCYSPNGKLFTVLKSELYPLGKRLSKKDAEHYISFDIIRKGMDRDRIEKLPEPIKNLQKLCTKTITIWNFMYPWNHPQQPKQFKDTLVLLGDGFVECRFDYLKDQNLFKVLQKCGTFMSERNTAWKELIEGDVVAIPEMEKLTKALV